jgi:hypothetical protein
VEQFLGVVSVRVTLQDERVIDLWLYPLLFAVALAAGFVDAIACVAESGH